jgi:hypothetical protein
MQELLKEFDRLLDEAEAIVKEDFEGDLPSRRLTLISPSSKGEHQ